MMVLAFAEASIYKNVFQLGYETLLVTATDYFLLPTHYSLLPTSHFSLVVKRNVKSTVIRPGWINR